MAIQEHQFLTTLVVIGVGAISGLVLKDIPGIVVSALVGFSVSLFGLAKELGFFGVAPLHPEAMMHLIGVGVSWHRSTPESAAQAQSPAGVFAPCGAT